MVLEFNRIIKINIDNRIIIMLNNQKIIGNQNNNNRNKSIQFSSLMDKSNKINN